MYEWMLDYFDADALVVPKRIKKGEIWGGYIQIGKQRIPITRGVPLFYASKSDKQIKKIINAYRQIDPFTWSVKRGDWFIHLREHHLRLISEAARLVSDKEEVSVLVLGCGWGWEILVLRWLFRRMGIKYRIVGCDLSLHALSIAKRILNRIGEKDVDLICCPIEKMPLRKAKFDLVTAIFGALDHIMDIPTTFRAISRVMKRDGVFVGTLLNKFALDWILKVITNPRLFMKTIKHSDKLYARIRIPIGKKYVRIPTHFYNTMELKKLLNRNNLELILLWGIFSILPMDFRKKKFNWYHKILAKLDLVLSNKPLFRSIGRYIGFIARKL